MVSWSGRRTHGQCGHGRQPAAGQSVGRSVGVAVVLPAALYAAVLAVEQAHAHVLRQVIRKKLGVYTTDIVHGPAAAQACGPVVGRQRRLAALRDGAEDRAGWGGVGQPQGTALLKCIAAAAQQALCSCRAQRARAAPSAPAAQRSAAHHEHSGRVVEALGVVAVLAALL